MGGVVLHWDDLWGPVDRSQRIVALMQTCVISDWGECGAGEPPLLHVEVSAA